MGEAEKKQIQFRGKGFSIDEYLEKMVSYEYTDEDIKFQFALCLLAK